MPEWASNPPEPSPGELFIFQAFWELDTCRSLGFGIGPIPWTAINKYADVHGLEQDLIEPFTEVIRRMDTAYIERVKPKDND